MAPSLTLAATAIAALLGSVDASPILGKRAATNAQSSLTLLFQNNLNATDDANHVGAILLDDMTSAQASAACSAIGESLLPWATIQAHQYDFERQLAYQAYISNAAPTQRYYIANNVISATESGLQLTSAPSRDIPLPVLCTQSSNSNSVYAAATTANEVSVVSGGNTFVGYRNQKSFRFLGIPYVAQPQRFAYSTYPSAPSGVTVQATAYGKQCSQLYQGPGATSENCLFLNIQTPYIPKAGSTGKLRAVHFYIHGGGFTGGTGADPGTDGGNMASKEDIVTVTINYRLSTLGFLAIPGTDIKGNFGIGDQINALKWVKDNIAQFGGDPTRVTINGDSAGAGSTRVLLGSQPAFPYFARAMSMSNLGGGTSATIGVTGSYATSYSDYYTIDGSYAIAGQQIFTALGCTNATLADQIACLRTKDPLAIVGASTVARYVVQDGYYVNTERLDVSNKNGSAAYVDVIFGITHDEGGSFITYPKTPVTSELAGLESIFYISAANAQKIIDSGLFPFYDTGNLTLDTFNVSTRIATDLDFRCVDQATVYAGQETGAFKSTHFYQSRRSYSGYDPNNLGGPPVTPGYPYGNPNLPYFRFHSSDFANVHGNLGTLRDANDLYTIQVGTGYFAEFFKEGTPNVPTRYLQVRGYDHEITGYAAAGRWSEVRSTTGPIMQIDYPPQETDFVDLPQCAWLGYPITYYIQ